MKSTKIVVLTFAGLVLSMSQYALADDAIHVTPAGDVGIGTNTPAEKMHILGGNLKIEQTEAGVAGRIEFTTAGSNWQINQNANTGRLTFVNTGFAGAPFKFQPGAADNLFRGGGLDVDTVDINGHLVVNGSDITPDYVFEPTYALESIEEHADMMWKNKHLPALPGADTNVENGVNVVSHQFGVLEELEKAHIYIDQLHQRLKAMENEQEILRNEQEELRQTVSLFLNKDTDDNLLTSLK
jgi:hypothetical protein